MTANKSNKPSTLNTIKRHTLRKGLLIITTLLLLSACELSNISPSNETVNDSTSPTQPNNLQSDTVNIPPNQIKTITEFPTHIKELSMLLHPLKPFTDADTNQGILGSYKDEKRGYQPIFEKMAKLEFTSHISNIVFEQTNTGVTQKLLPHNNFIIHNVFVPHTLTYKMVEIKVIKNTNTTDESDSIDTEISLENGVDNQINVSNTPTTRLVKKEVTKTLDSIIYQLSETPYSKDEDDKNLLQQHALYMSDASGKQMTKMHPDNEYLQHTQWKPSVSRYYFITQSDSDNNDIIDEKDTYHNYVIDFKQDNPVAKKYDFNK